MFIAAGEFRRLAYLPVDRPFQPPKRSLQEL